MRMSSIGTDLATGSSATSDPWLLGLVLPWLGFLALAVLPRRWDRRSNVLAVSCSATTTGLVTHAVTSSDDARVVDIVHTDWLGELGLSLHFIRDGLSELFALLVVWISLLVLVFAREYLPEANRHERSDRRQSTFHALMLAFTGAMLATVSSGNLVQLYFAWELTGIASYLLIGYWRNLPQARSGAARALGLTTAGGLALLIGLLLSGSMTHTWDVRAVMSSSPLHGGLAEICAGLIIVGALAKSAQFPFSNWLPGAMLAPTPVSAFLHSCALVALGVLLLARTFPLLHATATWHILLGTTGIVGALAGGLVAARQVEIKSLLAWSTVAMYAFIFLGFSLGTSTGVRAAMYAFFIHAFVKAGLFLIGGAVIHLTGQKELEQARGLGKTHRQLAAYAIILGLSLGGVPLTGGFYFKEGLLRAARAEGAWLLLGAMLVGGGFSIVYMIRFLHEIFVGPGEVGPRRALPWTMSLPIALIAALALFTGIFPEWMAPLGLEDAICQVTGTVPRIHVSIEPNPLFFTSLAVLAAGAVLWFSWHRGWLPRRWWERIPERFPLGGARLLGAYERIASACLRLHAGDLTRYLRRLLVSGLLLAVIGVTAAWPMPVRHASPEEAVSPSLLLAMGIVVLTTAANLFTRSFVSFSLTLTLLGFSLAAVFLLLHAPDVALAQVLVEMLATLSVILAVRQSMRVDPLSTPLRDRLTGGASFARGAIALGVGIAAGVGTWLARADPPGARVGERVAAHTQALTGAKASVAAILTDFRGLDTLGEILVFTIAVLAVATLYRREGVRSE